MAVELRNRSRRVTYGQLEILWEALKSNRSLATGYNKTALARAQSRRMWETVANELNAFGDGAVKDWKSWCKYWNDYKSKLKIRVGALRASHRQTGGGPCKENPLTPIEENFLQILGDGFGTGLAGIRVEPFDDGQENITEGGSSAALYLGSISVPIAVETSPQPGPSTWQDSGAYKVSPIIVSRQPPAHSLRQSPAHSPRQPPEHSPRSRQRDTRRRQRRGDQPVTMEMARRNIMASCQRKAEMAERTAVALEELVKEVKEMKNILISRLPLAPPTNDE